MGVKEFQIKVDEPFPDGFVEIANIGINEKLELIVRVKKQVSMKDFIDIMEEWIEHERKLEKELKKT